MTVFLVKNKKLFYAYIAGKRYIYTNPNKRWYDAKSPYDGRTKEGKMFKFGCCHGMDEQKGMFFEPPKELFKDI